MASDSSKADGDDCIDADAILRSDSEYECSTQSDADNTKVIADRYNDAKKVCYKILNTVVANHSFANLNVYTEAILKKEELPQKINKYTIFNYLKKNIDY